MDTSRKLTTYGKTSRKLKPDFPMTELDQSACQSSPIYLENKAQFEMKAPCPTDFPFPRVDATPGQGDQSQQSLRTLVRSRVLVRPHRIAFESSLRSGSSSPKQNKKPVTHEDDTVFEVPSSDNEQSIRLKANGSLLKRKRRNGRPGHIPADPGSLCEDVGLQRHVAAALGKEQPLSPGAPKNAKLKMPTPDAASQAISRCWVHEQESGDIEAADQRRLSRVLRMPSALDQASADHIVPNSNPSSVPTALYPMNQNARFSNNKNSALIREVRLKPSPLDNRAHSAVTQQYTTYTVKPILTGVRRGSKHGVMQDTDSNSHQRGSPINSDDENSSRAAASLRSFPLTAVSSTTTPRQKELWNLLLNDCEQKPTHSQFSLSSTRIKECDKAGFKRSGLPSKTSNLTIPVSGSLPTRRRLVDNLHQTDDNFTKTVDSLEDGGGSFLSPKKPALNFRKETALRVGSAPASKVELVPNTSQCDVVEDHIYVVPGTGHAAPLQQCGALKVTYARERSFLTDDDVSQQECFHAATTSELVPDARQQRLVARDVAVSQKLEVPTGDLDEVSDYQGSAMRSIHELREAGGNARVFSEMEAILDDIDEASASAPTVKRTKLLELAIKLQELSFCRLFGDQGQDQRIFAQLVPTKDVLVDTLVATIVLSLLAGSASTSKLHQLRVSRMISFMIGLLDRNQDLALSTRNRTFNISKVAQRQFKILWDLLLKSTTWRVGRPSILTPRVIALQCLEYIVRRIRENGCVDPVLSAGDIRSIVQLLQVDPSAETQQQQSSLNTEIHLSVSILESWTICKDPSCKDTTWTDHTLGIVIGLLSRLDSLAKADVGTLRTLTLRLYLNLTNNNPELCAAFSKPGVIGSMLNIIVSHFQSLSDATTQEMPEVMLDNLILALGSMINLAEWSDAVRLIVMRLEFMHTCFIDILLQLFLRKQRTAAEVRPYLRLSDVEI